ncbi:unnamed protein product [Parajaminaea phylloscopi]
MPAIAISRRAPATAAPPLSTLSIALLAVGVAALVAAAAASTFFYRRYRRATRLASASQSQSQSRTRNVAISEPMPLVAATSADARARGSPGGLAPVDLSKLPVSTSSSTIASASSSSSPPPPRRPVRNDDRPLRIPTPPKSRPDSEVFWISRRSIMPPVMPWSAAMTPSRSVESVREDLIRSLGELPSAPLPTARVEATSAAQSPSLGDDAPRRTDSIDVPEADGILTPILDMGAPPQWRLGSHIFGSSEAYLTQALWLENDDDAGPPSQAQTQHPCPRAPVSTVPAQPALPATALGRSSSNRIPVSRSESRYSERAPEMCLQDSTSSSSLTASSSDRTALTGSTTSTSLTSDDSCASIAERQVKTAKITPAAAQLFATKGLFAAQGAFTTPFHHAVYPDSPLSPFAMDPHAQTRALGDVSGPRPAPASSELLAEIAESSTTPKATSQSAFVSSLKPRLSKSDHASPDLAYVKTRAARAASAASVTRSIDITPPHSVPAPPSLMSLDTSQVKQEEWCINTQSESASADQLRRVFAPQTPMAVTAAAQRRSGLGIQHVSDDWREDLEATPTRSLRKPSHDISPIMQASRWAQDQDESGRPTPAPASAQTTRASNPHVCDTSEAVASQNFGSSVDLLALEANLSPRLGDEGGVSPLARLTARFSTTPRYSPDLHKFPGPPPTVEARNGTAPWGRIAERASYGMTAARIVATTICPDTAGRDAPSPALSTRSEGVWGQSEASHGQSHRAQQPSIDSTVLSGCNTEDVGHTGVQGGAATARSKLFETIQQQRLETPANTPSKRRPAGLSIYVGNSGKTLGNGAVSPLTPPFTPHAAGYKRSSSRLTPSPPKSDSDDGEAEDVVGSLAHQPTEVAVRRAGPMPPFKLRPLSLSASSSCNLGAGAGPTPPPPAAGAAAALDYSPRIASPVPLAASPSLSLLNQSILRGSSTSSPSLDALSSSSAAAGSMPCKRRSFVYNPSTSVPLLPPVARAR